MIHKCEVKIDLYQKLNYLSIITKISLRLIRVQLLFHHLQKKMNLNALNAYLRMHLSADYFLCSEIKINDRVIKITRTLQKIIKNFTS